MKAIAALALLLCFGSAEAQVYKWKDAKGVVHYSDTPVTSHPKAEEVSSPPAPSQAALPYALARAARKHPVTLYTADKCGACDQARAFLRQRGIPFAEKTVASDADAAALNQAGSDGSLPFLVVGRSKLTGFEAGQWGAALSAADYPATSMLPPSYRQAAAEPAAPVAAPAAARASEPAPARPAADSTPPKPRPDLPPGFQF